MVAVLLLAAICSAQSYVITTVAGTTSVGDGGPATEAQLLGSVGVAVDAEGNVYVADTSIHRIRKIDTSGTITTIAGDGVSGFSGDGGPAAEARISTPFAVAVDSGGNIYIADTGNNRLRKVDTSGTITTIAGISFGVSGISLDGAGNVYVAYRSGNSIHKVTARERLPRLLESGHVASAATAAQRPPPATYILPMSATTAFARLTPRER